MFDKAIVQRVDPALGLLLQLPASPAPAPAFAHVSNLGDVRIEKVDKAFKVGQEVKARVIGFRLVDGLALVSLKPSVLSQQVRQIAMELCVDVVCVEGKRVIGFRLVDGLALVSLKPSVLSQQVRRLACDGCLTAPCRWA